MCLVGCQNGFVFFPCILLLFAGVKQKQVSIVTVLSQIYKSIRPSCDLQCTKDFMHLNLLETVFSTVLSKLVVFSCLMSSFIFTVAHFFVFCVHAPLLWLIFCLLCPCTFTVTCMLSIVLFNFYCLLFLEFFFLSFLLSLKGTSIPSLLFISCRH